MTESLNIPNFGTLNLHKVV